MDKYEMAEKIYWVAVDFLENEWTIRKAAKAYGMSKSSLHHHFSTTLKETEPELYEKVKVQLEKNKNEKYIRGGIATKKKYLMRKTKISKVS